MQRDRSLALVLATAGAMIFGGSLPPWPAVELSYLAFAAGVGIIAIAARIAVEAGSDRRPLAAAGLSMLGIGVGIVAGWIAFDVLGESTFQGLTLAPLAFFAALAIIGSRIPMSASAGRPRSVALVLAAVALGAFLGQFAVVMTADPEWGPTLSGKEVGWIVAVVGSILAILAAWRLRELAGASPSVIPG